MKKLTKKERNLIYREAYVMLENSQFNQYVCHIFGYIMGIDWGKVNEKMLPEFFLFKDLDEGYAFLSHNGIDTYECEDKIKKIKDRKLLVLTFCITMTE